MAPSTLEQFIRFGTDAGEFAPFRFTFQRLDGCLVPDCAQDHQVISSVWAILSSCQAGSDGVHSVSDQVEVVTETGHPVTKIGKLVGPVFICPRWLRSSADILLL